MRIADPARFVVLSTQRSGSNWLEDRLDSHPGITMRRSEPFRRTLDADGSYQHFRSSTRGRAVLACILPGAAKTAYLKEMFDRSGPAGEAMGFRLMYDQLRRNPSLWVSLPAFGVRVIHLVRTNVLETYVSVLAARQSGVYLTRSSEKRAPAIEVHTTGLVDELRRRVAAQNRHRKLLQRMPTLELAYEDCLAAPAEHDHLLATFLGVSPRDLSSGLERTSVESLRSRIANYRQVAEAVAESEFSELAPRLDT